MVVVFLFCRADGEKIRSDGRGARKKTAAAAERGRTARGSGEIEERSEGWVTTQTEKRNERQETGRTEQIKVGMNEGKRRSERQ